MPHRPSRLNWLPLWLLLWLRTVRRMQRRRAVVIVVSDFLDDGPWPTALATISRRHRVHALCVHDPLDGGWTGLGLMDVVDAETGRRYWDGRVDLWDAKFAPLPDVQHHNLWWALQLGVRGMNHAAKNIIPPTPHQGSV